MSLYPNFFRSPKPSKFPLEAGFKFVSIPALPNEESLPNPGFYPAEVLSGLCGIRSAEPGSAGLAREMRSDREAESFAAWADDRGSLWTKSSPPRADELTGGEHFVEIDENAGLVFKSTRPGKFGFGVDVELVHPRGWKAKAHITVGLVDASTEEYLFRLAKQNELFGDDIRVLGMARYPQGLSILTTQPFYRGKRTEQNLINEWFIPHQWHEIPNKIGAFYNVSKTLLIMDALPRNVLTLETGVIMSFDVVVVTLTPSLKSKLGL